MNEKNGKRTICISGIAVLISNRGYQCMHFHVFNPYQGLS